VHGDINPHNVILDNKDQLKLIDCNHFLKVGEDLDVGYEPYVRSRIGGQSGADDGVAEPITEQLALGSIFGFITRGAELYHELEGPEGTQNPRTYEAVASYGLCRGLSSFGFTALCSAYLSGSHVGT
jgi:hypothetical protein